jgi:SHS2 domain-containing protein
MKSVKPDFTLLDHTADLGIRVCGRDLRTLFEVAAKSMMYVMIKGKPAKSTKIFNLSVEGYDLPDLMVRWLGEILYLFEGEHKLVTGVDVNAVSHSRVDATLETVSFNANLHEILCEIKAVTFHQIEVVKKDNRWEARIIFDL